MLVPLRQLVLSITTTAKYDDARHLWRGGGSFMWLINAAEKAPYPPALAERKSSSCLRYFFEEKRRRLCECAQTRAHPPRWLRPVIAGQHTPPLRSCCCWGRDKRNLAWTLLLGCVPAHPAVCSPPPWQGRAHARERAARSVAESGWQKKLCHQGHASTCGLVPLSPAQQVWQRGARGGEEGIIIHSACSRSRMS